MKIKYVGCDAFQVAFQGCLSSATLEALARGKERAEDNGEPSYEIIGGIPGHVYPNGTSGGYRFLFDQGELGAKWQIKRSTDPNQ